LKGERVRERALQSRTLTDRRSITLPLCVLAAGAVHGLAVMALLPVMITLPGPASKQQGASQLVDVDVMPASAPASPIVVPRDPETTAAIPAAEDHPTVAPVPDRDADDAGGDDAAEPAEPGIAAPPEPRLEPAATVVTPVPARIPVPLPSKAESEPAVSVPPAPTVEETSPPPGAKADDEASPEETAARLESSAGATATAVEPAEPEAEADAVEEDVPPPEAEAAKEMEHQPEAKSQEAPPPVPTLKPAKSAEPKARLTPQKKASAAPAKPRTARVRRPVRTRTVTTVTQRGLFQDLFGPPQPAKRAALRQPTEKQ
jgi:hypothetical protein